MIKINEEYRKLIPALTEEEFKQLEENIIKHGIREPLVISDGVLLDGHNRFEIATKNGIEYETISYYFDSEYDRINWIINNQLGRRNVTEEQKSYLRGKRYENEKLNQGRPEKRDQNDPFIKTAIKLANEYNVGEATIKRDAEFAAGVDKATPELKERILTGKADVTKKDIQEIAKAEPLFVAQTEEDILRKAKEIRQAKTEEKKIELEKKKDEISKLLSSEVKENKPIIENIGYDKFLAKFEDNSIDLLITDPPYSTDVEEIESFVSDWVPLALSKVKSTGRAFICIGAYPKEVKAYLDVLLVQDKFIVDNFLVWTYKNTLGVTPSMKYNLNYQFVIHLYSENSHPLDNSITNEMFSVQEINAPDGRLGNRYHTWQKPDELGIRLIRHASRENDLVVDCFSCTGTFPLMAAKLKRVSKGCDINIDNLKIAQQRGCEIL